MDTILISDRKVGDGKPCFIIAEVGVNHNGDVQLAKKMIDAAKDAGADAVKFQTFKSEGVATTTTSMADYQETNIGKSDSQIKMLRELELDYECFIELKEYCDEKSILFLSTAHSFDAIDFLDSIVPAHKISSGDITNIPSIEKIASKGKPIILSTGMATVEEISEALETIRLQGNNQIILLQCVSNYPSKLENQNLRTIVTLRTDFDILTGFSDHTTNNISALVAVSLGACLVEKHFTLDKSLPGPDHKASVEPDELRELIDSIREAESTLGDGIKKPTEEELNNQRIARKSLVASVDIPKGTIITREMIEIKRPETGIRPKRLKEIIGKKSKQNIVEDQVITEEMILW
ncbi:MAG: N-acetylneuraminate synthase [Candidatus Thorarchaeota archaeon]